MYNVIDFQNTTNENFWKVFQIQREVNVCSSFISYSLKVIRELLKQLIS